MLKVVEYIKENGLQALKDNFGIEIKEYNDRVVLNYSQINSPKFDPIVLECRGLILGLPELNIISIGFGRFFNYGEDPKSNDFDIINAITLEKIDGSLIQVAFDGKEWQVATRGTAYAEGSTHLGDFTFREVFEKIIGGPVNKIFNGAPENLVFVYEMTSPYTRVVKKYESCIYPLMIKDKNTLKEYWKPEDVRDKMKILYNLGTFGDATIQYPQVYMFNSFTEIVKSMKSLNTFDEGYVCVHGNGDLSPWRIKIKNPSYLAIAHMRGNGELSTKRLIELVFMNEYAEYLATFPEDTEIFQPYIDAYNELLIDINATWYEMKNISDQKEFALQVKNLPCSGILFQLKKNRSLEEIFDGMTMNYKINLINNYIKK